MVLTLDENAAHYQIEAYQPGTIKINQTMHYQSLIVSAEKLILNWPPQTITALKREHFDPILALKPHILLLGTGAKIHFPPIELYGDLINQRIGVEIMDTHAACRTYNALTAENRNVIAALIIA